MRRIAAFAPLALLAAAGPVDPATLLAGRYYEQFPDALVSGEKYTGENVVEIVPVAPRAAYVRFNLDFFNGHKCGIYGIATAQGDALVYREASEPSSGERRCTLSIKQQGTKLAWDDDGGTCAAYCGARGSLSKGSLAYASKRTIRYLPRLKASPQYRDALTEWRTGKPANP
ncbi:MAG: hypothetical protein K2Y20_10225 [Sphingomonas sp.]|nr:hypothetical protein [Sphingomonas sp.]